MIGNTLIAEVKQQNASRERYTYQIAQFWPHRRQAFAATLTHPVGWR
jgi:hypothetical protein